jgi:hypothetical protein
MAPVPLATGARLLGIHPKTLRHWLTMAHLPLVAHPTDARIRCVAQAALLEVASLHGRPLPDLPVGAVLEQDTMAARAAASAHNAPAPTLVDVLHQLAQLHAHVASVQHQLARLTLELLPERTGDSEQHLQSLQALVSPPVVSVQPLPQVPRGTPAPPEHRLLPVELRARSRVTALIEYGAQGQYVAVCPRLGVLSLVPDSPEWFDWLASLTALRFIGPAGRFSACRASKNGQHTRSWAARRVFHGHDFWYYLGVTDHLTLAVLEQAAAALQGRVDAL